jgi:predicted RNA-binding Zn-ribbon protein involved in translation (DUF1610 family)
MTAKIPWCSTCQKVIPRQGSEFKSYDTHVKFYCPDCRTWTKHKFVKEGNNLRIVAPTMEVEQ